MTEQAVEAILADFRSWLLHLGSASSDAAPPEDNRAVEEPLDLHTLLGQFIALRHEVNLQTRAVRAQQDQNLETLQQLSRALDALQQAQPSTATAVQPPQDELLRPLLKTLVDLYDALALAGREMQRVQNAVLPSLEQIGSRSPSEPLPALRLESAPPKPPSFLARLFGVEAPAAGLRPALEEAHASLKRYQQRQEEMAQAAERVRQLFDSIVTGYTMSLQRVERALRQHGLEPIHCVGQPFDPEQMEVVEVVNGTDRKANEVIDEVRRGYLWNGRVFRYAQVRVAKP